MELFGILFHANIMWVPVGIPMGVPWDVPQESRGPMGVLWESHEVPSDPVEYRDTRRESRVTPAKNSMSIFHSSF